VVFRYNLAEMVASCVFCQIVSGAIPAEKVWENEYVLAFKDQHPVAAVHVLLIPKVHITDLSQATDHIELLGKLQAVISQVAESLGITSGYKVILNAGRFQEVQHLHYHLLNE